MAIIKLKVTVSDRLFFILRELISGGMPNHKGANALGNNSNSELDAASSIKIHTRWGLLAWGLVILLVIALAKNLLDGSEGLSEYLKDTGLLFFAEVGVALVVAFFVGFFIERDAKQRELAIKQREAEFSRVKSEIQAAEAAERSRLMANNVIEGVYGLRHDGTYVKAVIDTNLNTNIVRDQVSLDYALSELSDAQVEALNVPDARNRFVILTMISSYTFQNLSSGECDCPVRYSVSVRQGEGAKSISQVNELVIGRKTFSQEEIAVGLSPSDGETEKNYEWPTKIAAGQALDVRVTVTSIKERSDNEVWGSFFATVSGLQARFHVLPGMVFGVRPLLASPLRKTHDQDVWGRWETSGPVLPNNSAVFWWRTPEDDAQVVVNVEANSGV